MRCPLNYSTCRAWNTRCYLAGVFSFSYLWYLCCSITVALFLALFVLILYISGIGLPRCRLAFFVFSAYGGFFGRLPWKILESLLFATQLLKGQPACFLKSRSLHLRKCEHRFIFFSSCFFWGVQCTLYTFTGLLLLFLIFSLLQKTDVTHWHEFCGSFFSWDQD